MTDLHVIESQPREGRFVCPWCAGRFPEREDLDQHWADQPVCKENRYVNSQTDSKDR